MAYPAGVLFGVLVSEQAAIKGLRAIRQIITFLPEILEKEEVLTVIGGDLHSWHLQQV